MVTAHLQAVLDSGLETVWQVVTDNEHYAWRSDLSRIEMGADGRTFTEYSKEGVATHFTITVMETCRDYQFDLENANLRGYWRGLFTATEAGTQLELTEELTVKKALLRLVAGSYLRRQQQTYLDDLRRELARRRG